MENVNPPNRVNKLISQILCSNCTIIIMVPALCLCVGVLIQGRVLRGVHGEGEEDRQAVCHEVCEEEAEEYSESGERDCRVEKVGVQKRSIVIQSHFKLDDSSIQLLCVSLYFPSHILNMTYIFSLPGSNTITSLGWRISMKVVLITTLSCNCKFYIFYLPLQ